MLQSTFVVQQTESTGKRRMLRIRFELVKKSLHHASFNRGLRQRSRYTLCRGVSSRPQCCLAENIPTSFPFPEKSTALSYSFSGVQGSLASLDSRCYYSQRNVPAASAGLAIAQNSSSPPLAVVT